MRHLLTFAALLLTFQAMRPAAAVEPLLSADFETDPLATGWWRGTHPFEKLNASWTDRVSVSGGHAIETRGGWWASPRFEVEPFGCYRTTFASMVEGKGYWLAMFYDREGNMLAADHYSSIYPSDSWQSNEFCFQAKWNAATAEIRFRAIDAPLYIDDVRVEPTTKAEVARWADRVYATIPPVELAGVPRPGPYLARSIGRLRDGERLRIVMLGDSIINDTGNSHFGLLVERMYPGAEVEVITSVRGGTGCVYYQHENRVQSYVLDLKPDLLVIGGISHGHDPKAVRNVVRQVRAKSDCEILLLSGAISFPHNFDTMLPDFPQAERRQRIARIKAYRPALEQIARQQKCGFLDLRQFWNEYEQSTRLHPMWLRRDYVHANARGRQVVARVLEAYFAPPDQPRSRE